MTSLNSILFLLYSLCCIVNVLYINDDYVHVIFSMMKSHVTSIWTPYKLSRTHAAPTYIMKLLETSDKPLMDCMFNIMLCVYLLCVLLAEIYDYSMLPWVLSITFILRFTLKGYDWTLGCQRAGQRLQE